MRLFHFWHQWTSGNKIAYAPPSHVNIKGKGIHNAEDLIQRMAFGVTTYKQVCKVCGQEETYEVFGTESR